MAKSGGATTNLFIVWVLTLLVALGAGALIGWQSTLAQQKAIQVLECGRTP